MPPETYEEWFTQNIKDQFGPNVSYEWNDTEVDLILTEHTEEVIIQQSIDFFASIDVPHLREGSIRTAFEKNNFSGFTDAVLLMMGFTENQWVDIIGENGRKIYDGLRKKFTNIPLYVLMGSLPYFGRGVGKRKIKKLEQIFGTENLHLFDITAPDILRIDGFQTKTVTKIVEGIDDYYDFYNKLPSYVSVQTMETNEGGSMDGEKVVFTGFRDKEAQTKVEELGGTMQSGVSGKTTILVTTNPDSNTGKMKKARDLGVKIMSVDDFKELLK